MARDKNSKTTKEAIGVYFDINVLDDAIDELRSSGFKSADLAILAGEKAVKQRMGTRYSKFDQSDGETKGPPTEWVRDEAMGDTVHGLWGGLVFAGAAVAAGTLVASVGLFGGAVLTAAVGAAAVGGVGAALAKIISKSDAEQLQEQIDRGHLLLFVRLRDSALEKRALEILSRSSTLEPSVHEVALPRSEK